MRRLNEAWSWKTGYGSRASLIFHNRRKRLRIQARAPNQRPVNFFFRHEGLCVFRFDRSTIQNPQVCRELFAKRFGGFPANQHMRVSGHLRCRGFSCADGPHGLVRNHKLRSFLTRNGMERAHALTPHNILGESRFTFFQHFADTNNGREALLQSCLEFQIDCVIGFSEILSALGVADDHMCAANRNQRSGRDFAGKRSFFFPVTVLRTNGDLRAFYGFKSRDQVNAGRADGNLVARVLEYLRQKGAEKFFGLCRVLVHLPVGGDQFLAGHWSFLSSLTSCPLWFRVKIEGMRNTKEHQDLYTEHNFLSSSESS